MPEVVRKRVNLPTRVEGDGRTLDYAVVHDTRCRASVSSGEQARSEPKERPVSVAVVGTTASSRGVRRSRSATRETANTARQGEGEWRRACWTTKPSFGPAHGLALLCSSIRALRALGESRGAGIADYRGTMDTNEPTERER